MARSPFTFAGALELADPDQNKLRVFDKILGGAIVAGGAAAAVVGAPVPVVGMTAATLLSLVDPKKEAIRLLAPLADKVVARFKGGQEDNQYDLVVAAHTITVLSSYFDGLQETLGGTFTRMQLTAKEMTRLAGIPDHSGKGQALVEALIATHVPLPAGDLGVFENLDQRIIPYYRQLTAASFDFFAGLDAWQRAVSPTDTGRLIEKVVDCAEHLYLGRMLRLGKAGPFALWVMLNEHAATRATIRAIEAAPPAQPGSTPALGDLQAMLALVVRGIPVPAQSYRAQLALAAKEVLGEPLLRSETGGLVSPTVEHGFVEPAFKLAFADDEARPADEQWWDSLPTHESLVDY